MKKNENEFEITELEERLEMATADPGNGEVEPLKCDNRCNDGKEQS